MPAPSGFVAYVFGAHRQGYGGEMAPLLGYAFDPEPGDLPSDETKDSRFVPPGLPIAVEFAGPKSVVDSIRRDLVRGDQVHVDAGAGSFRMRLARSSLYRFFLGTLPNGYSHLLCLHARGTLGGIQPGRPAYLVEPTVHERPNTPALPGAATPGSRLLNHFGSVFGALVPLPVFAPWIPSLWCDGLGGGLVVPIDAPTYGVRAWRVSADAHAWHNVVRNGLRSGQLPKPDPA